LQTSADSGAMAAAISLYRNPSLNISSKLSQARQDAAQFAADNFKGTLLAQNDVIFGFVDPGSKTFNPASFQISSNNTNYANTGGYNAVYVWAQKGADSPNPPISPLFASLVGIKNMSTSAKSIALIDQTVHSIDHGGLRPIYVCQAQFQSAMQDGVPENDAVRIYGDHMEVNGVQNQTGCPALGSGNWSFADLRNCSPDAVGTSTIQDWLASGFPGTVNVGQCYSSDPGNFIASSTDILDKLIAKQTIFPLPAYNSWSGSGSNTSVNVSSFVGFKITGYKATGSQSSRYIEGHFYRYVCENGCTSSSASSDASGAGTVVKIRRIY